MVENFDYKDINMIPKYGIVDSRSECDTSFKLGKFTFDIPVVPANMESVINKTMCIKLALSNQFYIMHRFDIDIYDFVKSMKQIGLYTSISIGVTKQYKKVIDKLIADDLIPDFITIDIAHGHSIMMKSMLEYIKSKNIDTFIIAGNVSTVDGVIDLTNWGANAIKAGIAGGAACTTSHNVGFGNRGFQASMIQELCHVAKIPVIADGSIVYPGDINKAIMLGAALCMAGSLFTGLAENSNNIIEIDGKKYCEYWGSASEYNSGKTDRIEGTKKLVEYKNKTLKQQSQFIRESIQSGISYSGGNSLNDLKSVKFKIIKQ